MQAYSRSTTGILCLITLIFTACGGSSGEGTPQPSPGPEPTTSPIPIVRTFEAEDLIILGNASTINDSNASGGTSIGNLSTNDDGISIENAPASIGIEITYKSSAPVSLEVAAESDTPTPITLSASDSHTTVQANIPIFEGDSVQILFTEGETSPQLDIVSFIPSPFQTVSTLADTNIINGDGVSVDEGGNVYVSGGLDNGNIIRVTPEGNTSIFATGFASANGSDFDSQGNLFVADYTANRIRKISPNGVVTNFATDLNGPASIYIDSMDQIYVGIFGANFSGTGATVLRFQANGAEEIFATGNGLADVIGITGDNNGNIYAGNWQNGALFNITSGTAQEFENTGTRINQIDYAHGHIYIAENNRITRVSTRGTTEVFSGTLTNQTINGSVSTADFAGANSLAFTEEKNILYVYDASTGNVRKIEEQ